MQYSEFDIFLQVDHGSRMSSGENHVIKMRPPWSSG